MAPLFQLNESEEAAYSYLRTVGQRQPWLSEADPKSSMTGTWDRGFHETNGAARGNVLTFGL